MKTLSAPACVIALAASGALLVSCSAMYSSSPDGQPPKFCTVFNHLVKSGGTSIKQQLFQSSEAEGDAVPGQCTSDGTTPPGSCGMALRNSSVVTGYGELLRNAFVDAGRDCSYFTMMRNPISRLVSAFYYCPEDHDLQARMKRPLAWCGNIPNPEPVTERLLAFARGSMYASMTYRQMLHSIFCPPTFEYCDAAHRINVRPAGIDTKRGQMGLEGIKRVLSSYNAVGIYEHWEMSMILFDANVESSVRKWDPHMSLNNGVQSAERTALLEWAYASPEINRYVAADMLLYEHGLELFRRQVKEALDVDVDLSS